MAKKSDSKSPSRADALRGAVDQAFQATAGRAELTQKRAQDIAEEVVGVVGRLRDVLDEARPVTTADLDALRAEITAVTQRVDRLEGKGGATPAGPAEAAAKPAGGKRPAGRLPPASAASQVPAARAAARSQAAKRRS